MERLERVQNTSASAMTTADFERLNLDRIPVEVLLLVTSFLEPADLFRSRYVSRQWHRTFTSPVLLRDMVVREYPRAREVQSLLAAGAPTRTKAWKEIFDKVFARYFALTSGFFYSEKRIKLHGSARPNQSPNLPGEQYGVRLWRRHFGPGTPSRRYQAAIAPREPFWTCDDGLLVYLDAQRGAYVVLDIQSNKSSMIGFDPTDRVVRRLRLRDGVLIFEWCQKKPYHQLNPTEEVHRHFVTAFDIVPAVLNASQQPFKITLRCEWKLHFLGFPLNSEDSWISAHNQDHYVVYIWQTNRSVWGEDEPLESLFVWDISQPSDYRPSEDPSGTKRPRLGPHITQSMNYKDLDFLKIRQRDVPRIRGIGIDNSMLRVIEARFFVETRDHAGPHMQDEDLRWNWLRATGIPVQGMGPRHVVDTDTRPWQTMLSEPRHLDIQRPYLRRLDKLTFDSAYPGQTWADEVSNIRFAVSMSWKGVKVCLVADEWSSTIPMAHLKIGTDWTNIYGDEKRLVMEFDGEIRIKHFDPNVSGEGVHPVKQYSACSAMRLGRWHSR